MCASSMTSLSGVTSKAVKPPTPYTHRGGGHHRKMESKYPEDGHCQSVLSP